MELPRRKPEDVYLPDGAFTEATSRLRRSGEAYDLRVGIVYAFDFRTRMLPYWYADRRMAPCSVRTLGDVLDAAGFRHIRIVLQQWTPNFRPSEAQLDGKPLDILLVSAMQVHAAAAYELIRDAHRLGESRPLIVAGGPKAIYEPTDYFEIGPDPGVGADCVVTGEAFVLLHFLETVLPCRETDGSIRSAFERARQSGALASIPGLVYLSPDAPAGQPIAINTGVQRLLRNLDELPMPDAGYRLLESPHRGRHLRARPYPARKVGKRSSIASLICTHGCRFNCPYCPIPAATQRTWRHKSPQRLAAEIRHIHENFGISAFFGTDDNFFNERDTVVACMSELARTRTDGVPLAQRIRFYTEATQFDVHKNRDILPLCRKGGLRGIWFGVEDITAELVNKGQTPGRTAELFKLMHQIGIQPMPMLIHSDGQPLRSPAGNLSGLLNQTRYLFNHGAVSYQCTYLGPAVGTRDYERAARSGAMFGHVGGKPVPDAFQDGNHVVASRHARPWQRELNLLLAYACFYNPVNTVRALVGLRKDSVTPKRLVYQFIGQVGLLLTIPKVLRWVWLLSRGPIERWNEPPPARIPMVDVSTGRQMNWGVEHPPMPGLDPLPDGVVRTRDPQRFPQPQDAAAPCC
jgi:radical SAM superfamily enzyme YgiQ (UPF0313 family)